MLGQIQKHEYLKQAAKLAIEESKELEGIASDILTNVVIATIRKYQQKINVGIQDSVSDLLENFKLSINEKIFNIANNWRVANRDYILFPRGCRFCYTRGDSTIVVVEQEPQIRSLLFDRNIIEEKSSHVLGTERLALALPYVIFILHFKKDIFTNLYAGWKNRPIKDVNDTLYLPILPNIHDNFTVCTGVIPDKHGENITQKCDYIISNFWNSRFNSDLSNYWWKKSNIDKRIRSAKSWSEFSLSDSSFILQINPPEIKSIKHFLNILTRYDFEINETNLRHILSENIDSCVEDLFIRILRYFRDTKFDKHHPKDIKDIIKNIVIKSNSELSDLIFVISQELKNLEKEINSSKKEKKVESKGSMWSPYETGEIN